MSGRWVKIVVTTSVIVVPAVAINRHRPVAEAAPPGTPTVPQPPQTLFFDDFQTATANPVQRINAFAGTDGQTYTASAPWLKNCNGWLASETSPTNGTAQVKDCFDNQRFWNIAQQLAFSIGKSRGMSDADAKKNVAVSAFSSGVDADYTNDLTFDFATARAKGSSDGRFMSVAIDTASSSCGGVAPSIQFVFVDGTTALTPETAINLCTMSGTTNVTPPNFGTSTTAVAVKAGTARSPARLITSPTYRVQIRNSGKVNGNDYAWDNLTVTDVSPQIDQAFAPDSLLTGATSMLTYTITNSDDLLAKSGFGFTNTLPPGLVIAAGTMTSTCTSPTITGNAGTATVTFTGSLAANAASCVVRVPVTSATAGTYVNTVARFTLTGLMPPDPATVVFGAGGTPIARCDAPSGVVNAAWPMTANVVAGATTVTISNLPGDQVGATGDLRADDLVVLMQVMDATINTTNTTSYGSGVAGPANGYTSLGSSGLWEWARVQSYNPATGVVTLQAPTTGAYRTTGASRAQVIRVPEYTDLTLTGDLVAPPLTVVSGDRVAGGVVAVSVSNQLDLAGFNIHSDALGFLGGISTQYSSSPSGNVYVTTSNVENGAKGMGVAATSVALQSSLGGVYGQGAPANGGGGGGDTDGGGGGGGNGGEGGKAGAAYSGSARALGGGAIAIPAGETLGDRLIMGGGGGGGNGNNTPAGPGGRGGGITLVDANAIVNSGVATTGRGEIRAVGQDGIAAGIDGGGGGGAGGTVVIRSQAATPSTVDLIAGGGKPTTSQNMGGAGGGGRIAVNVATSGTVSVAAGTGTGPATAGLTGADPIPGPSVGAPTTLTLACDFGDLPDATNGSGAGNYQSRLADNGPRHNPVGVMLGATRTAETDALHNTTATGDDGDDGITLERIAAGVTSLTVPVSVQGVVAARPACLLGYTDANNDGDFADAGESSAGVSNIVADGSYNLAFTGFAATTAGQTRAIRIRVTSDPTACAATRTSGALATGYMSDGEIEDYLLPASANIDLSIVKALTVPASGTIEPGQPLTWSVTLTNKGPTALAVPGVRVVDTVPAGVTGTWFCNVSAGSATCPVTGLRDLDVFAVNMPVNSALLFRFVGTVNTDVPEGVLTNTVTVATDNTKFFDPDLTNNTATVSSPVRRTADLAVNKTASSPTAAAGGTVTWTLTMTNNGPHSAPNAALTDVLPAGFTATSLTTASPGTTCVLASLTCTAASLANGATVTATLTTTISPTATTGTRVNRAVVSSLATDPVAANNTFDRSIDVTRAADMSVTVGGATIVAGTSGSINVGITNAGPSQSGGVVTFPLPAGVTFDPATSSSSCTLSGSTITCTYPPLAPGDGATFALGFGVAAGTPPGAIALTGTVAGEAPDPNAGNDSSTGTITVTATADLSITKTLVSDPMVAGADSTWAITVTNHGPSAATDVVTTDEMVSDLSGPTATPSPGTTCTTAGVTNGIRCTTATLAAGDSVTITLDALVDPATPTASQIDNTATVTAATPDPDPADNTSTDSGTTITDAELDITKSVSPPTLVAGEPAVYTITIENVGTSNVNNVHVDDTIPAGITIDAAVTATNGATCTFDAAAGTVACDAATLAGTLGANTIVITIPVTVDVDAPAGSVLNAASVSADGADPDSVSTGATVTRSADLALTKSLLAPGPFTAGTTFDWTLTASNLGPSSANDVTVVDTLPSSLTFVSGDGCTASGALVTCVEPGPVAPGADATFTITVAVAATVADGAVITNTASVTATEPDPTPATATGDATIDRAVDLVVDKTDSADPVLAGSTVVYQVSVTNQGPSQATGIVVTDTLPAGMTFVPGASSPVCSAAGQTVTCNLGSAELAPAGSVVVSIGATADASVSDGTVLTNSATATSTEPELDGTDNTATEDTQIGRFAEIVVSKTPLNVPTVTAGEPMSWLISLDNRGPSVADGVVITDTLDPRLTFVAFDAAQPTLSSSDACTNSGATVTCALDTLAVGVTDVRIVALVDPSATGPLANTATVTSTSGGTCSISTPCEATAPDVTVEPSASLSLIKTMPSNQIVAGGSGTFELVVTNDGPSTATAVTATDTLADGLTFDPAASSPECTAVDQVVTCALVELAPGSTTFDVAVIADPTLRGTVSNTASLTSDTGPDCTVVTPCTASVDVQVMVDIPLVVTKTLAVNPIVAGTVAEFAISVENPGLSTATNVVVTDGLAPWFTYVGSDLPCSVVGTVLTCDPFTLQPGGRKDFTIRLFLAETATGVGNNGAFAESLDDPGCWAQCAGGVDYTITQSADLALTLSADPIVPGTTGPVVVTVSNGGPSEMPQGEVVFTPPPGTTVVSAPGKCWDNGDGTWHCWVDGNFLTGDAVQFVFELELPADAAGPATLDGSATVSSPTPDPDLSNNGGDWSLDVAPPSAAVSISKELVTSPLVPGVANAFDITVTNDGPSVATGVVVTDTLHPSLTFDAGTSSPECDAVGQSVTCDLGDVAVGTTTVTVGVDVDPDSQTTFSNTATVTTATGPACTAGCTATSGPHTPEPDARVTIGKTLGSPVVPGELVEWTIELVNAGPSTATDVTVTDALDPRITFDAAASSPECAAIGQDVTCAIASFPAGTRTFTIAGTLDPDATGTIANAATYSSPDDPVCAAGCTTGSGPDAITPSSDLSVTMPPVTIVPGSTGTATATVTNDGPSTDAGPITVVFTPPPGTTVVDAPAGCSPDPMGVYTCEVAGPLTPGSSIDLPFTLTVPPDADGPSTTTGSITVTSPTPDPDTSNNTAEPDLDIDAPEANLDVVKRLVTSPLVPGLPATWEIAITNNGPSIARDVTIADTLAAPLTFLPYDAGDPGATSSQECEASGQDVTCGIAAVPLGTTVVAIAALVDAGATGSIANSANVTSPTGPSCATGCDVASPAEPLEPTATIATTKRLVTSPLVAGEPAQWEITLSNLGPSVATSVSTSDALDANLTFDADGSSPECGENAGVVTCLAPTLPIGDVTFTVSALVSPDAVAAIGNATTTAAPDDPACAGGCTATSGPHDVTTPVDLSVNANTPMLTPGSTTTVTVTASNSGPATATEVTVTYVPPPGVTVVTAPPECTANPDGSYTCTIPAITPGGSAPLDFEVTTGADTPGPASLDGAVSITNAQPETDPTDNTQPASVTITGPEAALTISKQLVTDPVLAGLPVVWTVTIDNAGPSVADDVTITDALDPRLAFVPFDGSSPSLSSSPGCTAISATVTCAVGDVPPGTVSVQIAGVLEPGATGTIGNAVQASTTSGGNCALTSPCDAAAPDAPIVADAPLTVTKERIATPFVPGSPATFRVTVTNAGPSTAVDVVLTDTLDPAFSFDAATSSPGCSAAGQVVTCSRSSIAPGSATFDIGVDVAADARGAVGNTVSVTSPTGPDCLPAAPCTATTGLEPLVPDADVTLTKTLLDGPLVAGRPATFDLLVTNDGPSDALAVTVVDTIPAGLTILMADGLCASAGQDMVCGPVDVATGTTRLFQVTVDVPSSLDGTIENVGMALTPDAPACDEGCSGATGPLPITRLADLGVTAGDVVIVPGTTAPVTVTVTNDGPSDVLGAVTVTFTPPPGTTVASAPAGCGDAGDGTWQCTLAGPVASGSTTGLVFELTVADDAAGPATRNGSVAVGSSTPDPNPDNDDDSYTVSITAPSATITVSKQLVSEPLVPGVANQFRVTITNAGPSVATGVEVTDTLDDSLAFDAASSSPECDAIGQDVACIVGTVPVGTTTVLVGVTVAPDARAAFTNTVTIESTTGPTCATGCTAESGPHTPEPDARVTITKQLATDAVPGTPIAWTVTLTNSGPSVATGIEITDTLDPAVAFDPAASSPECDATGQDVTCAIASLAVGSLTLTIAGDLDPGATGQIGNAATYSSPDDPACSAGCTATAGPDPLEPSADLSVTVEPATIVPGADTTMTVTVTNDGPSDAQGPITVTFQPPPGATVVSAPPGCVPSIGTSFTCVIDGPIPPSGPTSSVDLPFVVTVPPDTPGPASLTGTVSVDSPTPDADPDDNDATPVLDVAEPEADLDVAKELVTTPLVPGAAATWAITVTNAGPSIATGITVTDTLDGDLTFVPYSAAAPDTTSSPDCSAAGQDVTCEIATLGIGSTTVYVTAEIDPDATGGIANSAEVVSTTGPDCESGCTVSSGTHPLVPTASITTTKRLITDPFTAGLPATWTIAVANAGPSTATDVVSIDVLDPSLTFVPADSSPECVEDDGTITCTTASLPIGEVVYTIAAVVSPDLAAPLVNAATTATPTDPACTAGCTVTDPAVTPATPVDLAVTASSPIVTPGTEAPVVIIVVNTGPATAGTSNVVYTPPAGTVVSAAPPECAVQPDGTWLCTLDPIGPGGSTDLTFTVTLPSDAPGPETFAGSVGVSTPQVDTDPSNDTAPANITTTAPIADLAISKELVVSPIVPGEDAVFRITVDNEGPSTATNVLVTDELDPSLSFDPATSSPECAAVDRTVTCLITTLGVGTATLDIGVHVSANPADELSNGASMRSNVSGACTPECSTTTGPLPVEPRAAISMTKRMTTPKVTAGLPVAFEIDVRNDGPSFADSVVVTDTLSTAYVDIQVAPAGFCAVAGQTVTCDFPMRIETRTITIDATVAPGAVGEIGNTAEVTSPAAPACGDPCRSVTDPSPVSTSADLSVEVTEPRLVPGTSSPVSITVINSGPSDAAGPITVTYHPPEGVDIVAMPSVCSGRLPRGPITCVADGPLAPGDELRFDITVAVHTDRIPSGGSVSVMSPTFDPDLDDNERPAPVTVDRQETSPPEAVMPPPPPGPVNPPPSGPAPPNLPATGAAVAPIAAFAALAAALGALLRFFSRRRRKDEEPDPDPDPDPS